MRTDNGSRLVNEYVRMFLRNYAPPRRLPKPAESSPTAQVLDWKSQPRHRALEQHSVAGADDAASRYCWGEPCGVGFALLTVVRGSQLEWVAS